MTARALTIAAPDGVIDATLHVPQGGGQHPVVFLFTDFRGSRPAYVDIAEAIAAGGYAVLVPNLYYRGGPAPLLDPALPVDDAARARLQGFRAQLTPEANSRDFAALIGALPALPVDAARIGVVGYCMSGTFALRLAAAYPGQVLAAASFHGGNLAVADDPASPHLLAPQIRASVYIGHADQDATASPEQIARLDGALAEHGVHFITEFYRGARHGFTVGNSPVYDRQASQRHLRRLSQLFGETLPRSPAQDHA